MKYIDQISVGNYIVLESGTIVSHQNEDITFEVKTLNFVFFFFLYEKTEEAKVESKVEGKSLVLTHINFDSPFGRGLTRPIVLGTIDDKKIYIQYVVYSVDKSSGVKIFHYSFLSEKNSDDTPKEQLIELQKEHGTDE